MGAESGGGVRIFDAKKPDSSGKTVMGESKHQTRLALGDSYGYIAEKVGDDKVRLTVVDLLYQETFPMDINAAFNQIIGFSGDKLAYLDSENRVVLRTIEAPLDRSIRTADPIHVIMDGKEIAFHVPPMKVNGRVMVEMRPIFEQLGFELKWDAKTNTVTATKGH